MVCCSLNDAFHQDILSMVKERNKHKRAEAAKVVRRYPAQFRNQFGANNLINKNNMNSNSNTGFGQNKSRSQKTRRLEARRQRILNKIVPKSIGEQLAERRAVNVKTPSSLSQAELTQRKTFKESRLVSKARGDHFFKRSREQKKQQMKKQKKNNNKEEQMKEESFGVKKVVVKRDLSRFTANDLNDFSDTASFDYEDTNEMMKMMKMFRKKPRQQRHQMLYSSPSANQGFFNNQLATSMVKLL